MRGQTGCGTRVEEEREGPGAFRSWYAMGRERAQPSLILHLSPARALPDAEAALQTQKANNFIRRRLSDTTAVTTLQCYTVTSQRGVTQSGTDRRYI
jgi:hypothetical protein